MGHEAAVLGHGGWVSPHGVILGVGGRQHRVHAQELDAGGEFGHGLGGDALPEGQEHGRGPDVGQGRQQLIEAGHAHGELALQQARAVEHVQGELGGGLPNGLCRHDAHGVSRVGGGKLGPVCDLRGQCGVEGGNGLDARRPQGLGCALGEDCQLQGRDSLPGGCKGG
jgi:hypothetical protein